MKMLFVGPLWEGSTALQRLQAFESVQGLTIACVDSMERVGRASLMDRVRHKLRIPKDKGALNRRLVSAAKDFRPEVVFVDNVQILQPNTLQQIRETFGSLIALYFNDDISASHNRSRQLERCNSVWDVFFTTKSFNVPELADRGVKRPVLIGNSFDPAVHRPMAAADVGPEFERFDAVFVGMFEEARRNSINRLADAGVSVVVHGNGWSSDQLHDNVTLRPPVYSEEYTRVLHTGKLVLGFLRKMNRDQVTQRSVEVPAAERAMVAEKTAEHDELFVDGEEYVSFTSDDDLVQRVQALLQDERKRVAVATAGRRRCVESGYSTVDRAKEMVFVLGNLRSQPV